MAANKFKIKNGLDLNDKNIINIDDFNGDSQTVNISDIGQGIANSTGAALNANIDRLRKNNVFNAFRLQTINSKTAFSMVNQLVDEYYTEEFVDNLTAPYSHYKMNDNDSNPTVVDNGTGANDGTAQANTDTLTTAGKNNSSLDFNGTSDYIDISGSVNDIKNDTKGTISAWIRPNSNGSPHAIIMSLSASTLNSFFDCLFFILSTGVLRANFGDGTAESMVLQTVNPVPLGVWSHVACVQDGTFLKIYINGVEQELVEGQPTSKPYLWFSEVSGTSNTVLIGARKFNSITDLYFDGKIDDFRYYSGRALTEGELSKIYNDGNGSEDTEFGTSSNLDFDPDNNLYSNAEADPALKLLLHMNGDDNDFSFPDSNTPAKTVTPNGNVKVFEPKVGDGALFFNGTDQYLQIENSIDFDVVAQNADDYTIDFWFKTKNGAFGAGQETFMHCGEDPDNPSNYWQIISENFGTGRIFFNGAGGPFGAGLGTTTLISDAEWHHLAVIKIGTDYGIYLDGEQEGYMSSASTFSNLNSPLAIGCRRAQNPHLFFNGFMDNVRIEKGNPYNAIPSGALTNQIIPATTDLVANANTKLLINANSETLRDESPSNHYMEFKGNAHYEQNRAKFGNSSLKLDGKTQHMTVPIDDFDFFSSFSETWIVDFWVRHQDPTASSIYISSGDNGTESFWMQNTGSTLRFFYRSPGATQQLDITGGQITDNEWHHVAFVVKDNIHAIYLDGEQQAYGVRTQTSTITTYPLYLMAFSFNGSGVSSHVNGNVDELRIQKSNDIDGQTLNPDPGNNDIFTVPNNAYVGDDDTQLLMHFNSGEQKDLKDEGGDHEITLVGGVTIEENTSQFGNSSLRLNGSGQYLTVPDSPDWDIFANLIDDWTIDFWVKLNSTDGTFRYISQYQNGSNFWDIYGSGSAISIHGKVANTVIFNTGVPEPMILGQWHHVAVIKKGSTLGLYVDGTQVGYSSITGSGTFTQSLSIGALPPAVGTSYLNGNMDEVRIQKSNIFNASPNNVGVTGDDIIIVPTSPHTVDSDTKLLLHFDYTDPSEDLKDDSGKNHDVTVNGSPTIENIDYQFGNSSLVLNGVDQNIQVPDSSDWDIVGATNTDFTIDFWAKLSALGGTENYCGQYQGPSGDVEHWRFTKLSDDSILFSVEDATPSSKILTFQTAANVITDLDWHHIALIKKGGVSNADYGIYVDGTQLALINSSATRTYSAPLRIGSLGGPGVAFDGTEIYFGNIDEFRFSNTIRFSADPSLGNDSFTPPISAYTSDSNTKLLLHFDYTTSGNDLIDSGDIGYTVTSINGAGIANRFGTGSGVFDNATSDHLRIPNHEAFDVFRSTGEDWTIDFWTKHNDLTGVQNYIGQFDSFPAPLDFWTILYDNTSKTIRLNFYHDNTLYIDGGGGANRIKLGQWHHIAMAKVKDQYGLYLDGDLVFCATSTGAGTFSSDLYIGQFGNSSQYVRGNIEEVRIQKSNIFNTNLMGSPYIHYTMNETSGNTVTDQGTGENDGNSNNDTSTMTTTGQINDALDFNGTNDFINMDGAVTKVSTDSKGTIMMWVNADTLAADLILFSFGNTTAQEYGAFFHRPSGVLASNFTNGAGAQVCSYNSTQVLTPGTWTHVAMVQDGSGSGIKFYINGVLDVSVPQVVSNPNAWFNTPTGLNNGRIGCYNRNNAGNTLFFDGKIDDVRYYDKPFNDLQIQEVYNAGVGTETTNLDPMAIPTSQPVADDNTRLLLHFDGDFEDSSGAGHEVISVNGAGIAGRYGVGSGHFDGISDYLIVDDDEDFNLIADVSQDYTIDLWVRHETLGTRQGYVVQNDGTHAWTFGKGSNDRPQFLVTIGASQFIDADPITDNDWHHIAVVKKGGATNAEYGLYVDGKQQGYMTNSITWADISADVWVGRFHTLAHKMDGNMDEVRIQKSNIFNANPNADSTDTIVVPTSQPTTDNDTVLMLHFDGGFNDESNTGHTVSCSVCPGVSGRFGTGNISFDGTNSYLELPDSDDWKLAENLTSDFTIDFWVRHLDTPGASGADYYVWHGNSDYTQQWYFRHESPASSGLSFVVFDSPTYYANYNSGAQITDSNWHHIALIKINNEIGIYMDGIQVGYTTITSPLDTSGELTIGGYGGNTPGGNVNGNIDEFRMQRGNAFFANPDAGFTDQIPVPTTEHTADADTKLLIHGNGEGIADESGRHLVTASEGAHVIDKNFNQIGYFGGDNSFLTLSNSNDWDLFADNTSDMTVDFWMNTNDLSNPGGEQAIIGQWQDVNNFWFIAQRGNGLIDVHGRFAGTGSNWMPSIQTLDERIVINRWYHIAVIKKGPSIGIYINGIQRAYGTMVTPRNISGDLTIGKRGDGVENWYYNGFLDELHIHKSNIFNANPMPLPFAHYKMNETSGTVVTDEGTGANNGTATTDASNLTSTGKINNSFDFNNTDRVDVNSFGNAVKNDTTGTLMAWIKTTNSEARSIFVAGASGADSHANFRVTTSRLNFILQYNTSTKTYNATSTNTVDDGQWHHIVFVQDGTQMKLYIDGIQEVLSVNTPTGAGTTGDWIDDANTGGQLDRFFVGGTNSLGTGNTFFDGEMDDFRYYSGEVLSPTQIQTIYNSGNGTESQNQDPIAVPTAEFNNAGDMVLISDTIQAQTEPTEGRLVLLLEDITPFTLNTDLKAFISKDDGATWLEITLVDEGAFDTNRCVVTGIGDLTASGLGSGTEMRYKIETYNDKRINLHGSSLSFD